MEKYILEAVVALVIGYAIGVVLYKPITNIIENMKAWKKRGRDNDLA